MTATVFGTIAAQTECPSAASTASGVTDPKEVDVPNRTCSVEDCEQVAYCRGWCRLHYQRMYHHGQTDRVSRKRSERIERFWDFVDKDGPVQAHCPEIGPCWVWKSAPTHGRDYGRIRIEGKSVGSHRAAWMVQHGPIPDGLWVLHHCDNRRCVRPDHLFLGDRTDNMRDAGRKGRLSWWKWKNPA